MADGSGRSICAGSDPRSLSLALCMRSAVDLWKRVSYARGMCSIFDMVEHAALRGFFDSFLCVILGKCTYLEKRILNVSLETDTPRQMAGYMVSIV